MLLWLISRKVILPKATDTMEFFNVFRGLKKSSSETKLGDRLSFVRKSKSGVRERKCSVDSPLPPRPGKGRGGVEAIIENIPEDQLTGPSLHSPRRDTDQFGNICRKYEQLVIRGNVCHVSLLWSWYLQTTPALLLVLAAPPVICPTTPARGGCCWTVVVTRDATSACLTVRTVPSASQLTWWPAPPCLSSPWTRPWCTAVCPAEYFPPLQWPGDPATTDLVLDQGPGDTTGYKDTTGDQTLSTLTTSPSQVTLSHCLSCPPCFITN